MHHISLFSEPQRSESSVISSHVEKLCSSRGVCIHGAQSFHFQTEYEISPAYLF